ncbi:DUF6029 family protein [bacterium]|nr:DUF6029 family protein [bacterium]
MNNIEKYIITLLLFTIIPVRAFASLPSVSVSNYFRYGFGNEIMNYRNEDKKYLEEKIAVNIHWNRFLLGGRYDYDNPPEFGFEHRKLRKWYLEYRKGQWKLRGGTFAALFSRGLVLNAYEEEMIGHDSEITGVNALYENERTTVNILAGSMDYEMIPDFRDIVTYNLRGGSIRKKLIDWYAVGGSFIRSDLTQKIGYYKVKDKFYVNTAELWSEIETDNFKLYGGMASNSHENRGLFTEGENSVYVSLNMNLPSTNVNIEFKNYKFGLTTPEYWDYTLYRHRMLAFQNPPTVVREHSWVLLSRRTHSVSFNDEVGMQFDLYHRLYPETTLNLNGSVAGKHYRYDMNEFGDFSRRKKNLSWIPSLDPEYSPFWQVYGEVEHYFPNGSSITGGLAYTFERIYNYYIPDVREENRSCIIPVRFIFQLPDLYSLQGTVEYQKFKETLHGDQYFTNSYFSFGIGKSPYLTAAVDAEYVTKGYEYDDKTLWLIGTIRYCFRSSQIFEIGYGETRGGLVCTNGRCRYVPEYKGWRFSAEIHF